jgi:hypothetical protein
MAKSILIDKEPKVNTTPKTLEEAALQIKNNPGMSLVDIITANQKSAGLNSNSFENLQGAYGSGVKNFTQPQVDVLKKADPTGYTGLIATGIDGVTSKPSVVTAQPQTVQAPIVQAPIVQAPQQPQFDFKAELERMKQAQLQSSIAGLDKAKNNSLSNLADEQKLIQPMAYNDRNSANIGMNNANQKWNEFLAAKGLNSSGVAGQGFTKNQNLYQGEVGSINRDATNKEANILKRTTDVNNNYESDIAQARAGIEAKNLENYINQMNLDRTFNMQKQGQDFSQGIQAAGLTGEYNGTSTMEKQKIIADETRQKEKDKIAAQDKQKSDFIDTIGQYYNDISAETDNIANNNDPADDWKLPYLRDYRVKKIQSQDAEKKAQAQEIKASQNALTKAEYDNAMNIWKQSGVATQRIADILGIPVGSQTESYMQTQYDTAKPYYAPTNSAVDKINTSTTSTVDDYASAINTQFVSKDAMGSVTINKDGILEYLRNLANSLPRTDASKQIIESLGARFGIQ